MIATRSPALAVGRPGAWEKVAGLELGWPLAVLGGGAAVAAGAAISVQLAAAGLIVFLSGAVYLWRQDWGIAAVLAIWLLAPGLRRVVQLSTGYQSADPLSLAPFAATAVVAALALLRASPPRRSGRLVMMAAAGFAIGFPVGLLASPAAAVYALCAYLAGVSAALIGHLAGARARVPLGWALGGLLPVIAVYGIAQSVSGPTSWDAAWLATVDLTTIGVPGQEGKVRIFATLNAPGVLAGLLSLGLLWFLTRRRPGLWAALAVGVLGVALALTFVRAAWLALLIAAVAHVVVTKGASAVRVGGTVAVTVVVALASAGVSPTAAALVERAGTLGAVGQDESAQARISTPTTLTATAASAPIGHGLGQAGEAARLGAAQALRHSDNGYLALVYQGGLAAVILVLGAIATVMRAAWRGARDPAPGGDIRTFAFAALVFLLVFIASGDHFYGALGAVFWFLVGLVLADRDAHPAPASAHPPRGATP